MNKKIKVNKNKKSVFFFLHLLMRGIKKYGFLDTLVISYYELIYSFIENFEYFKLSSISSYYSEPRTYISGKVKKSSKSYDTPYMPTPYYFLRIIEKQIIKMKVEDFTFMEFGCGAGRVTSFFKNYFKITIGIDKNKNFKKFLTSSKQKFIHLNLRNLNKLNKIEKNIIGNIALYFNEPFDFFLVTKIIKLFLKRKKRKCLIITAPFSKNRIIKIKGLKIIFSKKFKYRENQNLYIYKYP